MSKSKGSSYERKKIKHLSLWLSNGKRDDILYRTAGSGARATCRLKYNQSTSNSCGDIGLLDPSHKIGKRFINKVLIELKIGYTLKKIKNKKKKQSKEHISITDLIDSSNSRKNDPLIIRWIKKANIEAKAHNREIPIIIYHRDRKEDCIVFKDKDWNTLKSNNRIWTNHDGPICSVSYKKYKLVIVRLDDFLQWCPPKAFYEKIIKLQTRRLYKQGKYTKIENLKKYPKIE